MNKPLALKKTDTIRSAFKLLNGQFGMIVCIMSNDKVLTGVVTEGDLRRAILKGFSLDTKLEEVQNINPFYVYESELNTKKIVKSRINPGTDFQPLICPVVDKNKRLLNILNEKALIEILQNQDYKIDFSKEQKPHVLVVGGAGYIGSVLTSHLLKKGLRVRVVDKMLYGKESLKEFFGNKNFSLIEKDICDLSVQVEVIKNIDCVIFLAEIVGDPSCHAKPEDALKTNYLAVSSMANLCSHMNINRFVYTSSCSVYGSNEKSNDLLKEDSTLNPISHYARIKTMSEKALFSQSNTLFSPTILRLATVCGPSFRHRFDLVVNTFARNAFFNKKINVQGGDQSRPNIHVDDVADAINKIIDSPLEKVRKQIFNLSNDSQNFSIIELAKITQSIFPNCKIIIDDKVDDQRDYRVSSKKIKNAINFEASKTVIDVLNEFKKIFEKQKISSVYQKKFSNFATLSNEKS
jgi:nucleoside-diphosphate-sugar epimerase|tara:strand:+ start:210 stop:1601 length:1392 start_codon:yes stop_codon:yes gene_type:complete